MPIEHANDEYPAPEEQHREYLYWLLDQRAEQLSSKARQDDSDLAELARIENLVAFYRIDVEREVDAQPDCEPAQATGRRQPSQAAR